MENTSKELTFIDLLEIIFKRKVLLAAITLIITVLGTLLLGVVYSNNRAQYSTSFIIEYPGDTALILPDGSDLKYTEFISEKSLTKVKNSNANYKNVDVKSITMYNDVSISKEIVETSKDINNNLYTITIKAKYFPNSEIAKSFIKDLATLPIIEIKEMIKNTLHDSYLKAYDESTSFDNKLSLLHLQKNYILSCYSSTISTVGNVTLNGKLITAYKQDIENFFLFNSLDLLIDELNREGYSPKNEILAASYQAEIDSLTIKLQTNQAVIDAIRLELGKEEYENKEVSVSKIAELLEENVRISEELNSLNKKLKYAKGELSNTEKYLVFEANVNKFYTQLRAFTNEYKENIGNIYEQLSSVSFEKSSIVSSSGRISIAISGALSFVIGFILASVLIVIIHFVKCKKDKA